MNMFEHMRISTRLLAETALKRGWKVHQLDEHFSYVIYEIPGISKSIISRSTILASTQHAAGLLCDNKWAFHKLMLSYGIAVPESVYCRFNNDPLGSEAYDLLNNNRALVVKPIDANHGDGVTIGVNSREKLTKAVIKAQAFSKEEICIVQAMVSGIDLRFLVVGGKTVAVSGRRPAFIIGNGKDSVRKLIEIKNSNPLRGEKHSSPLTLIDVSSVIDNIGEEHLDSIPKSGEEVELLKVANLSQGGEAINLTDKAHHSLKRMAEDVAASLNMRICGVDIMTTDITQNAIESGAVIIEANNSPGIRMHHFPSIGEPIDVASLILDDLERNY